MPPYGFTLVEMLVSLFLGSILSWTAAEVYLASVRSYMIKAELVNIQNNGRFSLATLRRELLHVGFLGGANSFAQLHPKSVSRDCVVGADWALDISQPLDFVDNFDRSNGNAIETAGGYKFSCLVAADIQPGTDVLSAKRTASEFTLRNGSYGSTASIKPRQWYLRLNSANASAAWLYLGPEGFPFADLSFNSGIDYWQYHASIYYIRRFSEAASDQIPSLCVERLGGGSSLGVMATQCVAEGVEDMQLEFGIDQNNDGVPDYFREAVTRGELVKIVAVRVYLLMRSTSQVWANKGLRTYSLGSKEKTTDDGFLRRVMSTTIRTANLANIRG